MKSGKQTAPACILSGPTGIHRWTPIDPGTVKVAAKAPAAKQPHTIAALFDIGIRDLAKNTEQIAAATAPPSRFSPQRLEGTSC